MGKRSQFIPLSFLLILLSACSAGLSKVSKNDVTRVVRETQIVTVEVTRIVPITQLVLTTPNIPEQDISTPTPKPEQSIVEPIKAVDMSLDGKYLAIITLRGLYLYASDTFQKIWFQPLKPQEGWEVKFSPNGKWLAIIGNLNRFYEEGQAEIRSVQSGEVAHVLSPASQWRSVNWSPDSDKFLTVSFEGEILVWQRETSEPFLEIQSSGSCRTEGNSNSSAMWLSDGSKIITSCFGALITWDAFNGNTIFTIEGASLGKLSPGFFVASPFRDDNRLAVAAGNFERAISIVDGETGQLISTTEIQFFPARIAWSPDGKALAVGEAGATAAELIDLETNKVYDVIYIDSYEGVFWSPDGKILYLAGSERIRAVNLENGQIINTLYIVGMR